MPGLPVAFGDVAMSGDCRPSRSRQEQATRNDAEYHPHASRSPKGRRISGGDRRNGNAAATIRPGLPRT
ncbi:hypothetical protein CV103_16040 [Sphingomonas fennica]|uniref:Uncharacterized protein n=1 Tax=Edaphosphingomonas fennica TaxID=114404 RepID=A0A2T4HQK5_9SPHN|nr:hypothetical protein CV103_16040 [Sphingomonas fennica]